MANEKLSKELILKVWDATAGSYKTVARTTSYSIEKGKETVEVTSFDSAGWKEFLVDLKEWSVSADGIVIRTAESGKKTYEELLQSFISSDDPVVLQMINPLAYTDATDGVLYSHEVGKILLTSLPLQGSLGDKQTYSLSAQGTGKLTYVSAKYDTQAEAFSARGSFSTGDVILVIGDIGVGNSGYYSRLAGAGTNFADSWTAYTI